MSRLCRILAVAVSLLACLCAQASADARYLASKPLYIERDGQTIARIQAEIARSHAERQHGLMFRTSLAPQAGMLFIYAPPQDAAMWMKNTLIPLDMLFIDAERRIVHIHPDATPRSLRGIRANRPVWGVLELRGGAARAFGIRIGDRINVEE